MRCCRMSDCTCVGVNPWRRGQSCDVAGCWILLEWVSSPGGEDNPAMLQDVGLYLSGCHPLEERTVMRCCRMLDCSCVGVTPWRRGQSCDVAGCRIVLEWLSPPGGEDNHGMLQDVGLYLSGCHPLEERTVMRYCRMLDCTCVGVTPWGRIRSRDVAGCWMSDCT